MWSTRTLFAVYPIVTGPVPGGYVVGIQSFSPERTVRGSVVSSNPGVIGGAVDLTLGGGALYYPVSLTPQKEGTATLTIDAPGFDVAGPVTVTVPSNDLPFPASEIALGKDMTVFYAFQTPYDFPRGVSLTVTSSDPTKVLVGRRQGEELASVAVTPQLGYYNDGFWITGLADSGDVTVTLAAPGFEPRNVTVHLVSVVYRLWSSTSTVVLGGSFYLQAVPGYLSSPYNAVLRANVQPRFSLVSSNPAVVRVDTPTFSSSPGLTVVGPGTAELTLTAVSGATVAPGGARATVTVVPGKLQLPAEIVVLGKNLQRPLFTSSINL
jgi:hypothetical protein